MTPQQWQRISELFEAALALPPEERNQWLTEACNGDEIVYKATISLLEADERATREEFLRPPVFEWKTEEYGKDVPDSQKTSERTPAAVRNSFTPKPVLLDSDIPTQSPESESLLRKRLRVIAVTYLTIFAMLPI